MFGIGFIGSFTGKPVNILDVIMSVFQIFTNFVDDKKGFIFFKIIFFGSNICA